MNGLAERTTRSGYKSVRLHYTADPDKDPKTERGRAWMTRALAGVKGGMSSSAWQREMEIDFNVRAGQKVFEGLELMKDRIMVRPFEVPAFWSVKGGYDWGKRNPFAYIEGTVDHDGTKYICYGAYGSDFGLPSQAELIKASPYQKRVNVRYADPSIWIENQVAKDGSYTSFQRIFSSDPHNIGFIQGRTDDIACVERLEREWFDVQVTDSGVIKVPKENPTLKIFLPYEFLWTELVNLHWADFGAKTEEVKGKKEEIAQIGNHAFDALKYWLLSLPETPIVPKIRSRDPALPLAGDLIGDDPIGAWDKWNAR